jgi:cholesterol transport system auxiliary component
MRIAVALLILLLGGCNPLLPGQGPLPSLYALSPKITFPEDLPRVAWQLVVEEPVASGGLDTQQIALARHPLELEYFAGARWAERAPRMVQTLLVESFENSQRIIAVGRSALTLRSDYELKSELRDFQAEYFAGAASVVRIKLSAKLVRHPRREIVASRIFEATIPIQGTDMLSIVQAFDEALGKVLKRIVEWTLTVS